jgi:hypothetical protein
MGAKSGKVPLSDMQYDSRPLFSQTSSVSIFHCEVLLEARNWGPAMFVGAAVIN